MFISTATSHDETARAADVAILPVGSFEQHGGHLPLATDTLIAAAIAERLRLTTICYCYHPLRSELHTNTRTSRAPSASDPSLFMPLSLTLLHRSARQTSPSL